MEVKLADFGFSRIVSVNDQAMEQYGTPYYMAPEVLQSVCTCPIDNMRQYGHECDN
jgi:serine/threonine protein kinase